MKVSRQWTSESRGQNRPGVSPSLPELHGHGGVRHPGPPQPTRLPPVLGLVQEVDEPHARAILAEHVGHLRQHGGAGGNPWLGTCDSRSPTSALPEVDVNACLGKAAGGVGRGGQSLTWTQRPGPPLPEVRGATWCCAMTVRRSAASSQTCSS